ncbi:uncharacterized protein [Nicotiana tomentosiformis]|uniref:uncharacterized protein n=1 Tax=Nicotiana tomentosiformis TaxID=4098 RepID=UPI00388CB509
MVGITKGVVLAKGANVKVPKRKQYGGARDAHEVADLLWRMDKYFEVVKEDDEVVKCDDMEKGQCKIETQEQFKKELKKQLYPVNVVYEARQKLRELRQTATIREYMRKFTTLMLQIPSLFEEDSLLYFMDGLKNGAHISWMG